MFAVLLVTSLLIIKPLKPINPICLGRIKTCGLYASRIKNLLTTNVR